MITVYVIGCGGIGGYVLDLLPKTIASCSIDLCYTEAQVKQIMADDNLTVLHSIVDTLVLVDGDKFNMHNAIRQEGGHGSKLVTHMRKIQDSALKRTFLRGMKLVGFPGFVSPGNIAGINASRSYTIPGTWRRYLQGVIPVEEESELLEA